MAWFDKALVYHIYPLGLTGAPKKNTYDDIRSRINDIAFWLEHIKEMGFNTIYIGPLFESSEHGYDTTDYKKLDSRLGVNVDFQNFVKKAHDMGMKVVVDGVFNHTGRDFFAFRDILINREKSSYTDWYRINFYGNNEYNDGFSYENWGGHNCLVKLNYQNEDVIRYMLDVVGFWIDEFEIDGIRLDAADVLDFHFMKRLRAFTNEKKKEFWLMGEVIHGDYNRWVNDEMLHSVTNYQLYKALYSGHNDYNYFEIAHTVNRFIEMYNRGVRLYHFVDNHDVERIASRLSRKEDLIPVHILLYTLFGIPSVYYGSEFAIEGKKEKHSDDSLRPFLHIDSVKDQKFNNPFTRILMKLGEFRSKSEVLSYGDYKELLLTNRQFAFSRTLNQNALIVVVNNDDVLSKVRIPLRNDMLHHVQLRGLLGEASYSVCEGILEMEIAPHFGEVFFVDKQEI